MKYSFNSDRIDHICNSSMAVISEFGVEKIVLFGGIQNMIKSNSELECEKRNLEGILPSPVTSFLSNKTYLISVK